jgi:SnoaL-like domain
LAPADEGEWDHGRTSWEDLEANVRWLRDVELIKVLPQRYAYGIDEKDFQVVRSVFHPECRVVGTVHEGEIGAYLEVIQRRLPLWESTLHFMGNQYVTVDADTGYVETWAVACHMEAADSPLDDLVLALRYQDDVVRVGDGWKILRRRAIKRWLRGPFPRPSLAPHGEPERP